jgi:hypothetical protein
MTDSWDGAAPTRDEDAVETDAHAASSAEELDEDRLRLDPLEAGMDPPERWSGVDKYGMTPYEQAHPRGLTDRLSEEEPEVHEAAAGGLGGDAEPRSGRADEAGDRPADGAPTDDGGIDAEVLREAGDRGQLADEAGGSVAAATRVADEPD